VRPVTVHDNGPEAQVQVCPPGLAVAVYEVIAAPPFDAGAAHFTVAAPFPGVPVTPVGAPGTVAPPA